MLTDKVSKPKGPNSRLADKQPLPRTDTASLAVARAFVGQSAQKRGSFRADYLPLGTLQGSGRRIH